MPYKGYYIVSKQFVAGEEALPAGSPVKATKFRTERALLEARYIREPVSEEDIELIEKEIAKEDEFDLADHMDRINELASEDKKPSEIAKILSDEFNQDITYQAVTKLLKEGEN